MSTTFSACFAVKQKPVEYLTIRWMPNAMMSVMRKIQKARRCMSSATVFLRQLPTHIGMGKRWQNPEDTFHAVQDHRADTIQQTGKTDTCHMRPIVISICLSLVSAACGHHGQLSETVPEEAALSYPALVPSEVISSEFRDAPKSDINHADLKARAARLRSRAKDLALDHTSASDSGNWTDGNSH